MEQIKMRQLNFNEGVWIGIGIGMLLMFAFFLVTLLF